MHDAGMNELLMITIITINVGMNSCYQQHKEGLTQKEIHMKQTACYQGWKNHDL